MSKTKKSKTFIKIIYFDEGSATDLLYILGGGKSTDKEEKIVRKLQVQVGHPHGKN